MAIYNISWDPVGGATGYLLEYREIGDSAWTTPSTSANPTLFTSYDLVLDTGFTYYIRVSTQGTSCIAKYTLVTLTVPSGNCCPDGYTLSPDESYCYQENTEAPTVIQSDICLAVSQRAEYSGVGTKLFTAGYSSDLSSANYSLLTTLTQWKANSSSTGPMNRNGVWVDTDCNGTKDPLTAGQILQLTIPISTSISKTVYVAVGGDNQFRVDVNGSTVVERNNPSDPDNFYYWYVFPVDILSGTSYFTFQWVGDGSVNDAGAAAIYDNTETEISSATDDSQLDILFQTQDYIGEHIDIATCEEGYFLDTTGGTGAYVCRQVLTTSPEECTTTTTTTSTTTSTTTTTAAPFNLRITTTLPSATADDVTGVSYSIVFGSFPLSPGDELRGNHSGFASATISVDIGGTPGAGNISFYRDASFLECVNIPSTPGTYSTVSTYTFSSGELLDIYVNIGTC